MSPARILIVDDKTSFRFLLKNYLQDAGYKTACAENGSLALKIMQQQRVDLILSDLVMPELDGFSLLAEVQNRFPELPFVVVTAHGSVESAVQAMKQGADDYLLKPIISEELLLTVARSLEGARLRQRCDQIEGYYKQQFSFESIKTVSPAMGAVLQAARQVATFAETTVSILGESGSCLLYTSPSPRD